MIYSPIDYHRKTKCHHFVFISDKVTKRTYRKVLANSNTSNF